MKSLDGRELAGFIKEGQARRVRELKAEGRGAKLLILRDNDGPVIAKYVGLKRRYGEDIGVEVEDRVVASGAELEAEIARANSDDEVSGIILQLPLVNRNIDLDKLVAKIASEKDVDGLRTGIDDLKRAYETDERDDAREDSGRIEEAESVEGTPAVAAEASGGEVGRVEAGDEVKLRAADAAAGANAGSRERRRFDSATATAINWLLAGYGISLAGKKIALVGRGRLVGAPLLRMWRDSGLRVDLFHRGSDLNELVNYDVIVTATGVPQLIKTEMVRPGAIVVDAGTASEGGAIVGDLAEELREREDLTAITPRLGGVGPLTVAVLFENVIRAASSLAPLVN